MKNCTCIFCRASESEADQAARSDAKKVVIAIVLGVILGLVIVALSGCATKPPSSVPAVSTAALAGHLTDAQQGVTAAQAALSPNDGKATVVTQWLNEH